MYKDLVRLTPAGTSLTEVIGRCGPPSVFMTLTDGGEPFGRLERPAGTEFGLSYFLAADAAATFGLNLTFCFDKDQRLIKVVEHW